MYGIRKYLFLLCSSNIRFNPSLPEVEKRLRLAISWDNSYLGLVIECFKTEALSKRSVEIISSRLPSRNIQKSKSGIWGFCFPCLVVLELMRNISIDYLRLKNHVKFLRCKRKSKS